MLKCTALTESLDAAIAATYCYLLLTITEVQPFKMKCSMLLLFLDHSRPGQIACRHGCQLESSSTFFQLLMVCQPKWLCVFVCLLLLPVGAEAADYAVQPR